MKRTIIFLLLITILVLPAAGVFSVEELKLSDNEIQWLNENKGNTFTLVTEFSDNYKYYINLDGKINGAVVDFKDFLESQLNIKIEIVPFDNITKLVNSMITAPYDIYYGPIQNEERTEYLNFIPPTLFNSYKLVTFDKNISNLYDIRNMSVGFIKNDFIVKEMQNKITNMLSKSETDDVLNINMVYYETRDELENALLNGEVQVIIEALITDLKISLAARIIELDEYELGINTISVSKDYPMLMSIIEKLMNTSKYDFESVNDKNIKEFNTNTFMKNLSEDELSWIRTNHVIYYSFPDEIAPLHYTTKKGEQGVIIDYLSKMAEILNLTLVKTDQPNADNHINLMNIHNQNGSEYGYTLPYLPFSISIIGNRPSDNISSLHELENNTVALYKDDPFIPYLEKYYSKVDILLCDSVIEAFKSVSKHKADYTLNNKYTVEYYLAETSLKGLYYSGYLYDDFGYIITSDNEELNDILSKYVIYNNLKDEIPNINVVTKSWNWLVIISIALPLLLIVFIFLGLYFNLKRETTKRIKVEEQKNIIDEKFEKILLSIIESLERATSYSDFETGQHTRRISQYCHFLAEQLGYSEHDVTEISNYSQLHDIGKIGISEAILKKPGKLTKDEYEEIKKHVKIGYDMIKPLDLGEIAENIIMYHHERWDGLGYLG
ncbi:MAG: transporter substrate-binding domain-containing protein [Clostridia bacterium]|nr:transporter substrate-binding domain-containing protein [Clostridia bacterium]